MSDFSGSPSRSASRQPAPTHKKAATAAASNWLSATNGVTAFVPAPDDNVGPAQPMPREKSRRETIQEYMRAYASGEVGRAGAQGHDMQGGEDDGVGQVDEVQQDQMMGEMNPPDQHYQQFQQFQHPPFNLTPEQQSYKAFLDASKHRRLQRHDLATRDVIWEESIARTKARLEAVNSEKATLEAKLVEMERERERYRGRYVLEVSEVEDQREERRWEEWLRVQRGIVMGVPVGEHGEGRDGAEEDEGGFEI